MTAPPEALLPFWEDEPELWFASMEQRFLLSNITSDDVKYGLVVGSLDVSHAREVRQILLHPPAIDKYSALKAGLIDQFASGRRLRTRLEQEPIGDRRPSNFLGHLRNLAATRLPESELREIWLGRFLVTERAILDGPHTASLDLDGVAKIADVLVETRFNEASVLRNLEERVSQLENAMYWPGGWLGYGPMAVDENRSHRRARSQSRSHSYSRRRSRSESRFRSHSRNRSYSRSQSRSRPRSRSYSRSRSRPRSCYRSAVNSNVQDNEYRRVFFSGPSAPPTSSRSPVNPSRSPSASRVKDSECGHSK